MLPSEVVHATGADDTGRGIGFLSCPGSGAALSRRCEASSGALLRRALHRVLDTNASTPTPPPPRIAQPAGTSRLGDGRHRRCPRARPETSIYRFASCLPESILRRGNRALP